ncbi:MAG: thioredoxin domain-containing protein, partial [Euryarchaeota archaeon]|nr:thioredoxin domain-containing protein [Euryarchaeota archaeon]
MAAALVLGVVLGYGAAMLLGVQEEKPAAQLSPSQLGSMAVEYLSENLLKPGLSASLLNVSPYGSHMYRVDVEISQGGRRLQVVPVYITRDGELLALQVLNLSEPVHAPRRVQVGQDDDPAIGPEDAPVVMIEFSDYQCPYCRKFWNETLRALLERYEGKIRYVYRDLPIEAIHPYALKAAEAANCAGEQGKYFEYHDVLFERQQEWSKAGVEKFYTYAEELGLDVQRF